MEKLIEKIEACEALDFETKLEALCEIEARLSGRYGWINNPCGSIGGAFTWHDSKQGHDFWYNVSAAVEPESWLHVKPVN